MARTIKYVRENEDLTDAGYDLSEKMSAFVDEAAEADYKTKDDSDLQTEVGMFWEAANKHPDSLRYSNNAYKDVGVIREMVFTLFSPYCYLEPWRRDEIKGALATLTKTQIVDALVEYGTAVNEFFRLLWVVGEHGGWDKSQKEEL